VFGNPKKRLVRLEKASEVQDQRKQKLCSNLVHDDGYRTPVKMGNILEKTKL
jgi:hypothetical protein